MLYKGVNIIFRDSNRLFASALVKLPKMLLTEAEQKLIFKEIFCYTYYTKERYLNNIGDIKEAHKHTKDTLENFVNSI